MSLWVNACRLINLLLRNIIQVLGTPLPGCIRGRNFGCNFGLGAISGPLTTEIGGELPTEEYLANIQIDLVAANLSIELLGVELL
jgi:hypothetical protein